MGKKSPTTALVLHRKSANRPEVKEAVKYAKQQGADLRVHIPWNKKDKARVVRELLKGGCRRIIAGGGDGTLNAVASAIIKYRAPGAAVAMGILPLGTANDLSHGLGLPCEDLGACLVKAATAPPRPMDVGVMNGHPFINVASGGFGAEVTATTPQDVKRALGGAAYTLNGLLKIWNMKPYTGRLILPGQAPKEGTMLFMAVGNNRLAGGGFEVAPGADPSDGLLDLVVLNELAMTEPTALIAESKDVRNPANRIVQHVLASEFVIDADSPLHINLDGEPVVAERLEFSVLPAGIDVVY